MRTAQGLYACHWKDPAMLRIEKWLVKATMTNTSCERKVTEEIYLQLEAFCRLLSGDVKIK